LFFPTRESAPTAEKDINAKALFEELERAVQAHAVIA